MAENGDHAAAAVLLHHWPFSQQPRLLFYRQQDGRFYLHRFSLANSTLFIFQKQSKKCNLTLGVVHTQRGRSRGPRTETAHIAGRGK